jgi:hypothetical protein
MTIAKLISAFLHYKAMNIGLWGSELSKHYPHKKNLHFEPFMHQN